MTVVCRMKRCPYNDGRSFCAKFGTIGIDENGMCNAVWRKGVSVTPPPPYDDKVDVEVLDEDDGLKGKIKQKVEELREVFKNEEGI